MLAYVSLEGLVTDKQYEGHLKTVKQLYSDDFTGNLDMELEVMHLSHTFETVVDFIKWLGSDQHATLYSQLKHIAKLILLMPATNAVSERSFSAMGRLKTAIRGSMGQSRLNSLLMLHVHADLTDDLDISNVIKEFVKCHGRRAQFIAIR